MASTLPWEDQCLGQKLLVCFSTFAVLFFMLIHEPAFDPIFWLHHCNADRLLSLWSALHPNVRVSPDRQGDGSFTISKNATVHEDTRKQC